MNCFLFMEISKSSFCCKNLVEKKRRKRKEWAGKKEKDEGKTETHDTLVSVGS